jgi:hypothetical protein
MKLTISVVIFFIVIVGTSAQAEVVSVEGAILGLEHVTKGTYCGSCLNDPRMSKEKTFVLLGKNTAWYYISNFNRKTLMKYYRRPVRVTGELDPATGSHKEAGSITADTLELLNRGTWEVRWTKEKDL